MNIPSLKPILMSACLCLSLIIVPAASAQDGGTADSFRVLDQPANRMMEAYLLDRLDRQFRRRDSMLAALETRSDWETHVQTITDSMRSWTGSFPERTPLNARITGRTEREDYIVENIIFESRPDFYVTANLYRPKGYDTPRPAVLNLIGHSAGGKSSDYVQRRSIAQAKKGFVALSLDGLGQGERQIEAYTRYGSNPGGVHKGIGLRAFLSGWHVFNIMAWDAIRAVDYLTSRDEVNSDQIAVTGASGGGQMATYILPLEPRISVAIPTDNPTEFSYHAHIPIGTDHEQAFFGAFASGIDMRGDPLFAQLPDPLLINASIDDQLNPPRGVWDLADDLEKAYGAYDSPEKFKVYMSASDHGYDSQDQREAAYAWMLRWMDGGEASFREEETELFEPEALEATPAGNVYKLDGSREPQEMVVSYLEEHRPQWSPVRTDEELDERRRRIESSLEKLLRIDPSAPVPPAARTTHTLGDGPEMTGFVLHPEPGIRLPGVLIEPYPPAETVTWQRRAADGAGWEEFSERVRSGPFVLYLNDGGKDELLSDEAAVDSLLNRGYSIFAMDLRGAGETAPGMEGSLLDFLIGKPLVGQRTRDVLSAVRWLKRQHADEISVWANGPASSLAAAGATVFEDRIEHLVLENAPVSFESIVRTRVGPYRGEILIPGVLQKLDLPQLYQSLAPRGVTLINPRTGDGSEAGSAELRSIYDSVRDVYMLLDAPRAWQVVPASGGQERLEGILSGLWGGSD